MTFLLIVAALIAAMNPLRLAAVAPRDERVRLRAIVAGGVAVVGSGALLAWWSSPIAGSIDVSGSSSIIAAGLALVVIGLRDSIVRPPEGDIGIGRIDPAFVPVFFPTLFTPAMAILSVAAGEERGVLVTVGALAAAMAVVGVIALVVSPERVERHRSALRASASVVGLTAVVLGGIVATHGVTSI